MSYRMPFFAICLTVFFSATGCGKNDDSPSNGNAAAGSGNVLYDTHCAKCHNLTGSGSGPKKKGPDLSKAGADSAHTVDWLAEHIRKPQTHEPKSTMPSFEGQLKPDEIKSLAEFLATMK